jgi:hypothetical protein
MSDLLQGVIAGVLVLAAAGYAVWRLGPASLRRRLGHADPRAPDSCSSCQAPPARPAPGPPAGDGKR